MSDKPQHHKVPIVRVNEVLPHGNADKLEIVHIEGYQVVVGKGQIYEGELAIYIYPDSVVPQTDPFKFIWENYVGEDGVVSEKRRRITVRKFRGEWSEGLLLPLRDFTGGLVHDDRFRYGWLEEGDDVSDALGVTHYVAPEPAGSTQPQNPQYAWPPKSLRGWVWYILRFLGFSRYLGEVVVRGPKNLPKMYDVEALKNHSDTIVDGEPVIVTEKIHGSNARYQFSDGKMHYGSRTQWKDPKISTVWHKAVEQNPWIEEWCRHYEGYTLYGEVTPTQKGLTYGCSDGWVRFFLFDILNPDGEWIPKCFILYAELENLGYAVPKLYEGPYDHSAITKLVDGKSLVSCANHIREGVVVEPVEIRSVLGLGRVKLKIVSNAFLEKDNK